MIEKRSRGLSRDFLDAMRRGLEHGRAGGREGWDERWRDEEGELAVDPAALMDKLREELWELEEAIKDHAIDPIDSADIFHEAADVANMAMMVADAYRELYMSGGETWALPEARRMAYWKTSTKEPGSWVQSASDLIEKLGGVVQAHAFGKLGDARAWMIHFSAGGETFKVVWPVLPHDERDERAAMRQAATMLFYDVKAKVLKAEVFGIRTAFFEYLALPDGTVAAQVATPELAEALAPAKLFRGRFPETEDYIS